MLFYIPFSSLRTRNVVLLTQALVRMETACTYTHPKQHSEHVKWKRFLMVLIQRGESVSELRGYVF